jgi:phage shock protein E
MKKILLLIALSLSPTLWAVDTGSVIVDVRTTEEYQAGHIEGALHKPHDQIDAGISALLPDKSQHIIVYCGSGRRAGLAKEKLESFGYTRVENGGGYEDMQKHLAKPSEENAIRSLEEQERTAVLKEDVQALERLWSEQLIVNNPQNEISADRGVVLDRVKRGLISYSKFERRIESIRFNEDLAIVMGSETVVRKGDKANAVHRRFTNIWRKSGSTWRMIARHANVIPHG